MKYYSCLFIFVFFFSYTFSQSKVTKQPFIITGQLNHLTSGQMIFFFKDSKNGYKEYIIDSAQVDSSGNFYLKTYNITEPVMMTLRKEFLSVSLYAAPGYNLLIEGDVSDISHFQQHKKITGIGAQVNSFLCKSDSLEWAASAKDTVPWSSLPLPKMLRFANNYERSRDSLRQLIFYQTKSTDKWLPVFNRISQLDTRFMKLYYLIYGVMQDTMLTYQQSVAFMNKYGDTALLHNLYSNSYLVAAYYQSWFTGTYPLYLRELKNRRTPGYKNEKEADLQVIDAIARNYKNQIREIRLYTKLQQTIQYCPSFEELSVYKEKLPVYINSLSSKSDRKTLDSLLASMEGELTVTQTGKPSPSFTAVDSTGKLYSLADYSGKVIYLDLWASWCVPCRAQMPHLKSLTEKYRGSNDVAFISIGVLDDSTSWKEAVVKDKPTWLQLFDKNMNVQKSYAASAVPKFILIDKKGNIVSFDAPKPGDVSEIEAMINKEIQK